MCEAYDLDHIVHKHVVYLSYVLPFQAQFVTMSYFNSFIKCGFYTGWGQSMVSKPKIKSMRIELSRFGVEVNTICMYVECLK